jgi:hypothetical protein
MKDFAFLATYGMEFEAKFIESKLADIGIPTFLKRQDGYPRIPSDRVDIFVNPEDFERAKALIEPSDDALTEDSDTSGS